MGDNNVYSSKIMTQLSSTDTGDETQKRFRYQHTATAYIALLMYTGKLPYIELLCEHHEDVLAMLSTGKFVGIQIKTQAPKLGLFTLKTESLKKSLIRFIKLDHNYPDEFDSFVFACNCNVLENNTGDSLAVLKEQALLWINDTSHKIAPRTLNSTIDELCNKSEKTKNEVLSTISKVTYQTISSLDDIDSKIITKTISQIPNCSSYTIETCSALLNNLISLVYSKSSCLLENPVEDYRSLLNADILNAEIINSKRLTRQEIEQALNFFHQPSYYLGENCSGAPLVEDSPSKLMREKMNAGAIDYGTIELMDILRNQSELYFLQLYHKNEIEQKKYNHIRTLIWSEASEIEYKAKKQNEIYGEIMLDMLLDRLRILSSGSSDEVGECPYQILKGQVGALTGECKIKFSKVPEGGWVNGK